MTQRDADVAKHMFAQLRKRVRLDPVLSKYGFVLVEAETAKPRPDVHRCQSPLPRGHNDGPGDTSCPEPEYRQISGQNHGGGRASSVRRSEERRVGKECRSRWSP